MSDHMLTRSTTTARREAGPEASGPRTDHHTTDGVGQVPASAGARSESPAPAASPVQAFLRAHPTEPAASALPDPAMADPPGSAEAETQDAPAVLGSQGPSSDSNPPVHAISPSETHIVHQGVGSIISQSVENGASSAPASGSAGDEGLSVSPHGGAHAQTQMLRLMQGMINELQEQQLVAMHALVESSQQYMRQEMCAALAEASDSARQGPTPGPEPYEDFSDANDSDGDAAGNDGTKYSTPSSSKDSVPPSTIRQSSLIRDGVGGGVGGARRPQLPATDSPQNRPILAVLATRSASPVRSSTVSSFRVQVSKWQSIGLPAHCRSNSAHMDAHHTALTTPRVINAASKTKAGGQDQTGRLRLKRAPAHTIMKAGAQRRGAFSLCLDDQAFDGRPNVIAMLVFVSTDGVRVCTRACVCSEKGLL